MDNVKHTPGPWHFVRALSDTTAGGHVLGGSRPGYLAEVRDWGHGDAEANGHLIAAAPELFEALLEFSSAVWDDCRLPGALRADLQALYRNVVVPALRKARGIHD